MNVPEYFFILTALLATTIFLHIRFRVVLWRNIWHFILFYAIMGVVAIAWDQYAIWRGHWSFGNQYLLGIRIGYMPIEEYLFIFIPSYFGLVVYKIIERFVDKKLHR